MEVVLSQVVLNLARKYISNLQAGLNLSLWGGDVVLNNLQLQLDNVHELLKLPSNLRLTKGFIGQ